MNTRAWKLSTTALVIESALLTPEVSTIVFDDVSCSVGCLRRFLSGKGGVFEICIEPWGEGRRLSLTKLPKECECERLRERVAELEGEIARMVAFQPALPEVKASSSAWESLGRAGVKFSPAQIALIGEMAKPGDSEHPAAPLVFVCPEELADTIEHEENAIYPAVIWSLGDSNATSHPLREAPESSTTDRLVSRTIPQDAPSEDREP